MANHTLASLLSNYTRQVLFFLTSLCCFTHVSAQHKNWQSLPIKLNSGPLFFYSDSILDKLIVGGIFWEVNNAKNSIFQWDGTKVSLFDTSYLMNPVLCALRYNDKLYMTGFPGYGNVFIWNDTSWKNIGDQGGHFNTLYNYKGSLIAGVYTDSIQGKRAGPILIKDSNNNWSPLYGIDTVLGLDLYKNYCGINSIIEYNGDLFAGGNIDHHGSMKEIVRWHNNKWTDVGGGIGNTGDDWVNDMAIYKGELYVAGSFYRKGGSVDNNIIRWDGTKWKPVGGGVTGNDIMDLQVFNNELWAVGKFWGAGGVPALYIAKWDGIKWCGFGNKFDNAIGCLGVYKNELYIGGGFWSIDGDSSMAYIAKWIGGNFTDTCGFVDYTAIDETIHDNIHFFLYPNPFSDDISLTYELNKKETIHLDMYDALGKMLTSIEIFGEEGSNNKKITLSNLKGGLYYYVIHSETQSTNGKMLKLD